MNENKQNFAPYLKGIGQIMLQDNPWTGLFFLAGIFFDSFIIGIAAVLSVVTGTFTAKLLKYPEENINSGLYGFSATLVGVALTTFFNPLPVIWIAIIVGSVLAAIFQNFLISKKIPGFTFPFIVVTWALYFIFTHFYVVGAPAVTVANVVDNNLEDIVLASRGFGEIIFQASIIAGILFFIGVFIANPVAALYGLAACVISSITAYFLHEPITDIQQGMFSFNAVLCAITFSGIQQKNGVFVLFSVLFTIGIEVLMIKFSFTPYLTFPFVGASWLVLAIKKALPEAYQ